MKVKSKLMPRSKNDSPKEIKKSANLSVVGSTDYYQNIIKTNPKDQKAYDRLMILYRQQKEYKKELQIINTAIKVFDKILTPAKSKGNKVNALSNQLNKALGLVDNKGKALFEQQPLSTWRRRREIVLKKIRSA